MDKHHEKETCLYCFINPLNRGFLRGRYDENTKFSYRNAEVLYFKPEALKANIVLLNQIKNWSKNKGVTSA